MDVSGMHLLACFRNLTFVHGQRLAKGIQPWQKIYHQLLAMMPLLQ